MNAAVHPETDPRREVDRWLGNYAEDHRNATNVLIHWICVPAILWTVIAAFWVIPVPSLLGRAGLWAGVAMFFAIAFYMRLSRTLGLAMFGVFVVLGGLTELLYRELGSTNPALPRDRRIRRRVDRAIHRPSHRRQTAVVPDRSRLSADRSGVDCGEAVAQGWDRLLNSPTDSSGATIELEGPLTAGCLLTLASHGPLQCLSIRDRAVFGLRQARELRVLAWDRASAFVLSRNARRG